MAIYLMGKGSLLLKQKTLRFSYIACMHNNKIADVIFDIQ